MDGFPRDKAFDATPALLSQGYLFIPRRSSRYGDGFRTRLMLRQVACLTGEAAASLFYEGDAITRAGATPKTTLRLLQDEGSVQTLDGDRHRHRKRMFMGLMTADAVSALANVFAEEWHRRSAGWRGRSVSLLDESIVILCRTACRWTGIALAEDEADQRSREFARMIEGAGTVGPRNWHAHILRSRTERWVREVVRRVRLAPDLAPAGSPLRIFCEYRDDEGNHLPDEVVAVELINLLRPTVAISRYIVFAVQALHENPAQWERLSDGSDSDIAAFVNEVRRFYPFFPFVAGYATRDRDVNGGRLDTGDWVLLDLYGTNRDARIWEEPDRFVPERFDAAPPHRNHLIPQGGGDHFGGHRCPGEWVTIALVARALRLFREGGWEIPDQDFTIDLARIPARPRSGMMIRAPF